MFHVVDNLVFFTNKPGLVVHHFGAYLLAIVAQVANASKLGPYDSLVGAGSVTTRGDDPLITSFCFVHLFIGNALDFSFDNSILFTDLL